MHYWSYWPVESLIGEMVRETSTLFPVLETRTVSNSSIEPHDCVVRSFNNSGKPKPGLLEQVASVMSRMARVTRTPLSVSIALRLISMGTSVPPFRKPNRIGAQKNRAPIVLLLAPATVDCYKPFT